MQLFSVPGLGSTTGCEACYRRCRKGGLVRGRIPIDRPGVALSHADPQHPHRSGLGGDVVRADRGGAGALRLQRRQRPLQPPDPVGRDRLGGAGAGELGHELLRGVMPRWML